MASKKPNPFAKKAGADAAAAKKKGGKKGFVPYGKGKK